MELGAGRIILAVKEPVGVVVELVPPFVLAVQWSEERSRVGRVNHHRPLVLAAKLPERVDLGIVHGHEMTILVAMPEPQGFMNLQPLGPGSKPCLQPLELAIGPSGLLDPLEVDQGKCQESSRMGVVERGERFFQSLVPAAVEVDHRPHPGGIHLRQGNGPPAGA